MTWNCHNDRRLVQNWTQTQKPKAEMAECLTMFIKLAQVRFNSTGHRETWNETIMWREWCGAEVVGLERGMGLGETTGR